MGFTEPPGSPRVLVRSYRTVSPLPVPVAWPSAVCSLWHFPAGHPDWALPSTLPCGVRTFLGRVTFASPRWARTRPPGRLTTEIMFARARRERAAEHSERGGEQRIDHDALRGEVDVVAEHERYRDADDEIRREGEERGERTVRQGRVRSGPSGDGAGKHVGSQDRDEGDCQPAAIERGVIAEEFHADGDR